MTVKYSFLYADITVLFNKTLYNVAEDEELIQPVLVFSDPLSIDVTVEVTNINRSATGE